MERIVRTCVLILSAASLVFAQKTAKENMTYDRGRTPVARGTNPLTLEGVLVDASCKDRSRANLTTPPESLSAAMPVQPTAASGSSGGNGGVSAQGVSVDAKTVAAERGDVLEHQAKDLATRQFDPTCAVTGGTSAYAVLLSNGRLLDLDEGGNTLASEAVLQSANGRAMLNGNAYGFKPQVKLTGRVRGDRIIVTQLAPK